MNRFRVRVEFDAEQIDVQDVWESVLRVLRERIGEDAVRLGHPYAICEKVEPVVPVA